jgi:transcription antitermination factor NusG
MMSPLECKLSAGVSNLAELSPLDTPKTEQAASQWYAAYTCPRHEKYVARQLDERCIDSFLPLYRSLRRWKDRRKQIELPLFPGYVFVHFDLQQRLRILGLPGVVRLVSFNGQPATLPEHDIETLRKGLDLQIYAEPHPYLRVGRRVRVVHGPMAGTEGILVRKKDKFRLVISLEAIMRSIAVEVDAADVQPV